MSRFLRSKRLRNLLWIAADGKCQRCGCDLTDNWHADHIEPFSRTGRTNVHEMQALCEECNLKKGTKMLRSGQKEFKEKCSTDKGTIVAAITQGGGKSRLPVIACMEWIGRIADRICWVVPRISLAQQAESEFLVTQKDMGHKYSVRKSGNEINPCRGHQGYVTTYQAIASNPELHKHEFSRCRYILVLDEPQLARDQGVWGAAVAPLWKAAARRVIMSGGLERWDRKPIAFVEYEQTAQGMEPKTDVKYTRVTALTEKAILPLEFHHSDASVVYCDGFGQRVERESFEESGDRASEMLFAALQTDYSTALLSKCHRRWIEHRSSFPRAAMLVIANSIGEARRHLSLLRELPSGESCEIATSDEADAAIEAIERFRAGTTKILVTVQMAYIGLNVPQISHIACLTYIRSKPWIEQAIARANRNHPGKTRGFIYVPDDPLMNDIIKKIKDEQLLAARMMEEKMDGSRNSAGGHERRDPMPIAGGISRERLSELDGDATDKTETSCVLKLLTEYGVGNVDNIPALVRMMKENGMQLGPIEARGIVELTPSQEERVLKKRIENMCRRVDKQKSLDPGETNRLVFSRFNKSRTEMTLAELRMVWAFLQERYGYATSGQP